MGATPRPTLGSTLEDTNTFFLRLLRLFFPPILVTFITFVTEMVASFLLAFDKSPFGQELDYHLAVCALYETTTFSPVLERLLLGLFLLALLK